jgi:hypothetical protein
MGGALICF